METQMRILVVHDRAEIGKEIEQIATQTCEESGLSRFDVHHVDNCSDARSRLVGSCYDLLIIDLTLPVLSGGAVKGFQAVEDLLEELFASPQLLTPGNIVGITKDAIALDKIENNLGRHLMAVIPEDDTGSWRKQIADRTRYVLNSSKARSHALLTKHDIDWFVITALDKELAPFAYFFELQNNPAIPGLSEFVFTDMKGKPRRGACFAIGRAGQPSAASAAQGLLCQLRPRLAIMTGFCGGVPGKAELGTILFAESAIDWDYGKWKPTKAMAKLYSRPEPVPIRNSRTHLIARKIVEKGLYDASPLNTELASLSNDEITEAVFDLKPFASGSAVIGAHDVLESIAGLNDSIGGVDMESFGFYFACHHAHAAKPEFICIKAVADDCGIEKDDRLHAACCFASAHVAKAIATQYWDFEQ
jgi:nucleoside phosphorylase/CheY-like chemotaxis protein